MSAPHASPLEPDLPFRMRPRAAEAARDVRLRQFVRSATTLKDRGRADACRAAFGNRTDDMRSLAARIREHTLDHLDAYLDRFVDRATAAGMRVHFARDAAEARAACLQIAAANGCRLCVKSKSMATEEIRLLAALEAAGIETVETDLGEFILQLDHDAPSHIVTPMIHKDRTAVARSFERTLGAPYTEDPTALTMIARAHLREKYRGADLGITGANFLVAETGSLVVCTNEGNADFALAGPRVHVAVVGIEKLVPAAEHLSVLLKLLARSATAQPLTVYTSIVTGPRREGEHDGPEQVHVILLDNGRSRLLAPETRELLRCIRCGACLNACPVYRTSGGGHAYGAVYSGPIGAVLTPALLGLENYPDLPHASSLCGACYEACPVMIDIPAHLVRLRQELVERGLEHPGAVAAMRAWARLLMHPSAYQAALASGRLVARIMTPGTADQDPLDSRAWLRELPGTLGGWTDERDFPSPATTGFRRWWSEHTRAEGRHE